MSFPLYLILASPIPKAIVDNLPKVVADMKGEGRARTRLIYGAVEFLAFLHHPLPLAISINPSVLMARHHIYHMKLGTCSTKQRFMRNKLVWL